MFSNPAPLPARAAWAVKSRSKAAFSSGVYVSEMMAPAGCSACRSAQGLPPRRGSTASMRRARAMMRAYVIAWPGPE